MQHLGLPLSGGFTGVDMFFVVSGFVITAMLLREWSDSGRIRIRSFYARRFLRLSPALAVVVVVTSIGFTLVSPLGPRNDVLATGRAALLFVANVAIVRRVGGYFDAPAAQNPFLHTWSLSVEEQLYLVVPVALLIALRLARRVERPAIPLVAAAAGTITSCLFMMADWAGLLSSRLPASILGFYSPLTRAWEFGVGALLSLWAARRPVLSSPGRATIASLVGIAALVGSLTLISSSTPFPGPWTALPVLGTALVIAAGCTHDGVVSRALACRPLVAIGDRSYSLYLWHWPTIVIARLGGIDRRSVLTALVALSVLPAWTTHRWIERPLRRAPEPGGRRSRVARTLAVPVLVVPALALPSAIRLATEHTSWGRDLQRLSRRTVWWDGTDCTAPTPLAPSATAGCARRVGAPGLPVYLVGDSHALQYSGGLELATARSRQPFGIAWDGGCLVLDVWFDDPVEGLGNARCRTFTQQLLAHLRTAPPGIVVLGAFPIYWTEDRVRIGRSSGPGVGSGPEKAALLDEAVERTAAQLVAAGHRVVLLQPIPIWDPPDEWRPERCSIFRVTSGGCQRHKPYAQVLEEGKAMRRSLLDAARSTGALAWDPGPLLCPDGTCSTDGPRFVRYLDRYHISVAQSRALAPVWSSVLRDLADVPAGAFRSERTDPSG